MSAARSSTSPAAAEAPGRSFGPFAGALTAEEFVAFAAALGARQRRAMERRFAALAVGGGAVVAAGVAALFLSGALPARAALSLFGVLLAGAGLAHVYVRRQIVRAQAASIAGAKSERPLWASPRRVTLDRAGVRVETGRESETTPWPRFAMAERVGPVLALWSAAGGLALPLRALGDAATAERIEAAARDWIAAARADRETAT